MRAYDEAVDTIAMSAELTQDSLESALLEAKRLHAAYQPKENADTQAAWVAAHNEAVPAFRQVRAADQAHASRSTRGS